MSNHSKLTEEQEEKPLKEARWNEFQTWKVKHQSEESKKWDIEKQWKDFDEWKAKPEET